MEDAFTIGFLVLGLVFFTAMIWYAEVIEDKRHDRKMEEAREFGYTSRQERKNRKRFPGRNQ